MPRPPAAPPVDHSGPLERQARATLRETARTLAEVQKRNAPAVAVAAELILGCFENGGTVYFCGNGGGGGGAPPPGWGGSGRAFGGPPRRAPGGAPPPPSARA